LNGNVVFNFQVTCGEGLDDLCPASEGQTAQVTLSLSTDDGCPINEVIHFDQATLTAYADQGVTIPQTTFVVGAPIYFAATINSYQSPIVNTTIDAGSVCVHINSSVCYPVNYTALPFVQWDKNPAFSVNINRQVLQYLQDTQTTSISDIYISATFRVSFQDAKRSSVSTSVQSVRVVSSPLSLLDNNSVETSTDVTANHAVHLKWSSTLFGSIILAVICCLW